jgi:RHS repeat-associated protein
MTAAEIDRHLYGVDQRFYTSTFGRFMSADRCRQTAKANDSGSWNKYSYTRGDPVNRRDPSGTDDCEADWCLTVTGEPDPGGGGGQKGNPKNQGNDPVSDYVQCNPGGNPTTEKKLNFIWNNYADAAAEAATVQSGVGKPIDTGALTTLFLQWSANESGYGVNPANAAENNFFGIQNPSGAAGLYGGTTVVCNSNGNPIPTNTTNACFGAGVSWGQELGIALGIASSKTGVTYLMALETALGNGANATQALQAVANNGWNASPTYASAITRGIQIQTQINCLQKNGYI